MRRLLPFILIGLILTGVIAVLYLRLSPRLVEVSPKDGEADVSAGSTITLTFSRPMVADSVIERLAFEPHRSGTFGWLDNSLVFTPDRSWPNGETVVVSLADGAYSDDFIHLAMRDEAAWTFDIGQPRLVYLYPAEGPANIYTLNVNTGESERLTDYLGGVLDYSVDPGGTAIYFSQRNGQSGSSIYRLDLIGELDSEPVVIVECVRATCRSPQVSPQGDFLAYERTAFTGSDDPPYPQVWLLPLSVETGSEDTSDLDETAPTPGSAAYNAADALHQTLGPHWSPGGLLTYYDFSLSAFVMQDPHGEEVTLFPNQTGQQGSWHPSGDAYAAPEIFFVDAQGLGETANLDSIGSSHLMLFRLQDGKSEDLTQVDTLEDTVPVFSPGGESLAFARKFLTVERWTPGRQLWLMNLESGDAQQLTNDPFFNHFNFAWSPAGNLLAFVRFNQTVLTEPPEVWVIDPQTTQATRLVEGGFAPQWIP
jgi:Tol biopolymer transport system component